MRPIFVTKRAKLEAALPVVTMAVKPDGMIWISWPKGASRVAADITEETILELCLPACAIDETWSGLKLVIRKERR